MWKSYSYLEKSYNSLFKICYPKGTKPSQGGDNKAPLIAVKQEKSSVGDIVGVIPQVNSTSTEE